MQASENNRIDGRPSDVKSPSRMTTLLSVKCFSSRRWNDGPVGNDERALRLGDDVDQRLLVPMHELTGTKREAAPRRGIGHQDPQLRQIAGRIRGVEQDHLGRVNALRVIGMHFERARRLADQNLLFEQLLNGPPGRHVADARFLGEPPLAGDAVDEVVALADPPLDDGHDFVVFAGAGIFA